MKRVIITGATGDLGRVVVPMLAHHFTCIAVYRSAASWSRFPQTENVEGAASFEQALALASAPHALVHLAGSFATDNTSAGFRTMFESNLLPAVDAIRAIGPHLADGGRIVAISAAASLSTPAGLGAYVSSKAALNALILSQAEELRSRRITANALLPTAIGPQAVTARHIGETIAFLLSDGASEVTSQLIVMKG